MLDDESPLDDRDDDGPGPTDPRQRLALILKANDWIRTMERECALRLIAQQGRAFYCAGPGRPRVACESVPQWDYAQQRI